MPATLEEYMVGIGQALKIVSREYTTTSAGTTTTLISTDFAGISQATALDHTHCLITSGANDGEARRAARTGVLSLSTNTYTVAAAYSNTVQSGVTFRFATRLPWFDTPPGRSGLREIVNDALMRLWVEDRISISGVTGQKRYSLSLTTYPWLNDVSRVLAVYQPTVDADDIPREYARAAWDFDVDGETIYLDFPGAPWKTGESFTLKVHRPANSRLRISSVWTDSDSEIDGLTAVTDAALPTVRDVRVMGMALAYRALASRAPGEETAYWESLAQIWEAKANRLKNARVPRNRRTGVPFLRPTGGHAPRVF